MKIAIIGAGAYGTALGEVLIEKNYQVDYYDPLILPTKLDEVLSGAEMTLLAAPSFALADLLPGLPKDRPLVVATKGVLSDKVFSDFSNIMVLSGPGFADDIKAHHKTFLTITDKELEKLFGVDYLEFDYTADTKGVLMCGALKNVYAILAGYLGVLPGNEEYDSFITDVAEEMQALLSANGAEPSTVNLYCGIGDLRLTCDTPSRNYQYGSELKKDANYQPEMTVEGLSTLELIRDGEIVVPDNTPKLKQLLEII